MVASGGESQSRSCLLQPVDPPQFQRLGCRAIWSPLLLVSRAIASVTFRLRAAPAAAPVPHTLCHPCFSSQKLRLRGCRRCLRLLILCGCSPLGLSSCSVSLFGPVSFSPSWLDGEAARELGFLFPFSFSFGVVVTPRIPQKELEWDFPSGCSSFTMRGYPASSLAVEGNGFSVLQACPFFGTVTLFPSETLLFPSYAPRYRLRHSGCACLGLRPCGKCLRLYLQKVP